MKLPRRQFPASGSGRCRAAGCFAHRSGASLSDAAGTPHLRLSGRRRGRHRRPSGGSTAVGADRPAIVTEDRPGAGGNIAAEIVVRCAAGRLHAAQVTVANAINATLYRSSNSISSATSRRSRALAAAKCHGGHSVFSGQDSPRVHRLCQGQSGQDQHGVAGNGTAVHVAGELFKMMTDIDMIHVPYRAGRHARSARRAGASRFYANAVFDRVNQGR